jgi:tetratricopeptide (TPR) repeat protein
MPRPTPPPEEVPPAPRHDAATLALLAQSDRAATAGRHDEAIAYVERALRIHGDDVELWLRLAELQLAAARPGNAEQLAQRAIALAGSRTDWQRRGWLIVADAREALGDAEEAERIRFQWRSYRG